MTVLGSAVWRRICSYARIPNLFAWSEVLDMDLQSEEEAGSRQQFVSGEHERREGTDGQTRKERKDLPGKRQRQGCNTTLGGK